MGLITFLIVCPLVFLGGFVDSIAGGGGLISLPAYVMTGMPVHFAIGTNKLSSAMGTTVSTLQFARSGYMKLKLSVVTILAALLGSFSGARIALHISDYYFRIILLVVLPLTALYSSDRSNVRPMSARIASSISRNSIGARRTVIWDFVTTAAVISRGPRRELAVEDFSDTLMHAPCRRR